MRLLLQRSFQICTSIRGYPPKLLWTPKARHQLNHPNELIQCQEYRSTLQMSSHPRPLNFSTQAVSAVGCLPTLLILELVKRVTDLQITFPPSFLILCCNGLDNKRDQDANTDCYVKGWLCCRHQPWSLRWQCEKERLQPTGCPVLPTNFWTSTVKHNLEFPLIWNKNLNICLNYVQWHITYFQLISIYMEKTKGS